MMMMMMFQIKIVIGSKTQEFPKVKSEIDSSIHRAGRDQTEVDHSTFNKQRNLHRSRVFGNCKTVDFYTYPTESKKFI